LKINHIVSMTAAQISVSLVMCGPRLMLSSELVCGSPLVSGIG
jgi:hypothetical protein